MKNKKYVLILSGFLSMAALASSSSSTSIVTRLVYKSNDANEFTFAVDARMPKKHNDEWKIGYTISGDLLASPQSSAWNRVVLKTFTSFDISTLKDGEINIIKDLEDRNLYLESPTDVKNVLRDTTGKPICFLKYQTFETQWYHGLVGYMYSFLEPSSVKRNRRTCYIESASGRKVYLEEPEGHIWVTVPYIQKTGNKINVLWAVMRDVANFSNSSVNQEKNTVTFNYGEYDCNKWEWAVKKECFVIDPNQGRKPDEELHCYSVINTSVYSTNNTIKGFFTLACGTDLSYMFSYDVSHGTHSLQKIAIDNIRVSAMEPSGKLHVITYPRDFTMNAKAHYYIADCSNTLYTAEMKNTAAFFAPYFNYGNSTKWYDTPGEYSGMTFDPFALANIVFCGANSRPYLVYDSLKESKGALRMNLNIVPLEMLFTAETN